MMKVRLRKEMSGGGGVGNEFRCMTEEGGGEGKGPGKVWHPRRQLAPIICHRSESSDAKASDPWYHRPFG